MLIASVDADAIAGDNNEDPEGLPPAARWQWRTAREPLARYTVMRLAA